MNIEIMKMGINGEGIGYLNKKPVFIEGAFPSEIVDCFITEELPKYAKGEVKKIIKASPMRIKRECSDEKCKACSIMELNGKQQVIYKKDILAQALYKYAHIPSRIIDEPIANYRIIGYRNQFKMPLDVVDGVLKCGMFLPNSNIFTPIEHCCIYEKELEQMRLSLEEVFSHYTLEAYDKKSRRGYRFLVVRHFEGKFQITIVTGKDYMPAQMIEEIEKMPGVIGLSQSINTGGGVDIFGKEMKLLRGDKYLQFKVNDILLNVSSRSFFQLNTYQAEKLYKKVHDLLAKEQYKLIIEAYSGVGGLGISVSDLAQEVIGIENINSAVNCANENARLNDADNAKFIYGDASQEMLKLVSKGKRADVVIVDPPRSGLDDDFLNCLMDTTPRKIVYISCNPSTLGKDLNVLVSKYKISKLIPFDMFSCTAHVESITLLTLKK